MDEFVNSALDAIAGVWDGAPDGCFITSSDVPKMTFRTRSAH